MKRGCVNVVESYSDSSKSHQYLLRKISNVKRYLSKLERVHPGIKYAFFINSPNGKYTNISISENMDESDAAFLRLGKLAY
jgi:hypothetical protein